MTVLKQHNPFLDIWEAIFVGAQGEPGVPGGPAGPPGVPGPPGTVNGMFNVRDYGATGNGTTTENTAIQAAITAASTNGGTVLFPPGRYKITTTMIISADNVSVELDPAAVIDATGVTPHDRPAFRFLGSFVPLTNRHLALDAPIGSETITMNSVTTIVVGDLIGLWSTDPWTDERPGYYKSEFITVTAISGNVLTLARPLRDSYTVATTADFTKYNQRKNCTWRGGKIYFDVASFDNSGTRSGLAFYCVDNFRVSDLTVENAEWGGIDIRHARFGMVDNCFALNCGNFQGDTGYGISISGESVSVNGCQAKRCRHGLDVNGGYSSPISRDISVNGMISTESYSASISTHAGCERVVFNDCQTSGGNSGIIIRGKRCSILGGYFEAFERASSAPGYGRPLNLGDDFVIWNGGNGPAGTDLTVVGATFRRIGKPGSTSVDDCFYSSAPLVRAYIANNHFLGFTGHGALLQGNWNTQATFVGNVWDGSNQTVTKNGIYISPHVVSTSSGDSTDININDTFYNINSAAFRLRPSNANPAQTQRITVNSPYAQAAEFVRVGSGGEHLKEMRISGRMAGGITSLAQVLVLNAINDGQINIEDISYAGDGGISHGGAKLSFFGAVPVVRPGVLTAATDATTTQNLVNSLRTALVNLGLVT